MLVLPAGTARLQALPVLILHLSLMLDASQIQALQEPFHSLLT